MKINEMIIAGRGTSFDPALVDEFVKIGDKIKMSCFKGRLYQQPTLFYV